jgi:hypothetical protein
MLISAAGEGGSVFGTIRNAFSHFKGKAKSSEPKAKAADGAGSTPHAEPNTKTETDAKTKEVEDFKKSTTPKEQLKDDAFTPNSRRDSSISSSGFSGKTATETVNSLPFKQVQNSLDKLYTRSAAKLEKLGLKNGTKNRRKLDEQAKNDWANNNLSSSEKTFFDTLKPLEQTHFKQASTADRTLWKQEGSLENAAKARAEKLKSINDLKAARNEPQEPNYLQNFYNNHSRIGHTNSHDTGVPKEHFDTMVSKHGVNKGRSEESLQKEADGIEAKANAAARQIGTNKAPTMANQPVMKANEPWKKDDLFDPPAYTEKAAKDIPTSSSTSAAGDKPVLTSRFRKDLPGAAPLADIRRTSSSTLGGNSIKETSPNDLIRERPWSQGSNTTLGSSRPSSIHEKESAGNRQSQQDKMPPTYEKAVADSAPIYEKSALKDNLRQRFNNWHSKWTGRADTDAYNNARIAKIQEQNSKGKDVEAYRNTTADSQNLTSAQHARFAQTDADRKMQADIGSKYGADRWGTHYGGGQTGVNVGSGRFDDHGYNAGDF